MLKTVYIPKTGYEYPAVAKMFEGRGWAVVHEPGCYKDGDLASLLCLTGGSDVSPYLYGEENISSYCDPKRDEIEQEIYDYCKGQMPMVGICRGGQFLNVMNGGRMIQHIDNHGMTIRVIDFGEYTTHGCLEVKEDHHQGMVPAPLYTPIAVDLLDKNPEVIWYPDTRSLCFQPHPEWGHQPTEDLFFQLIEEYLNEDHQ